MSVAAAITQPIASDFVCRKALRLLPGSLRWTKTSKHHLTIAHLFSSSVCHFSGRFVRSRLRGQHESRVRAGVLARDSGAASGTVPSVVGSDLIVLGLPPEALVTVASVGATNGAPVPQTSLRAGQRASDFGDNTPLPKVLVATEALAGESDGLPTDLCGEELGVASVSGPAEALSAQTLTDSATSSSVSSSSISRAVSFSSSAAESSTAALVYVDAQAASAGSALGAGFAAAANGASINSPMVTPRESGLTNSLGDISPAQEQQKTVPQPQGLLERIAGALSTVHWGKLWALSLLFISYVHQATTGFALPAMLPMISNELHLTDIQGALLTTGYSYLYAVALVPIGLLADRVSRPKLLAAGLALWSILTCTASTCRSFGELMLARVGFAAAQGAQNPVCFSLIPELFPVNKSTALSLYNCAIYVGRALSFAAVLLARHLHDNDQAHLAARGGLRMETRLDHLDRADLHSMAIMHTAGDMAAATPDHEFNFPLWEYGNELPDAAWRQVLRWIAIPGFLIGLAMTTTLQEPRHAVQPPPLAPPPPTATVVATPAPAATAVATALPAPPLAATPAAAATTETPEFTSSAATSSAKDGITAAAAAQQPAAANSSRSGIWALLRSPGFMSVTLAAALNDVGSYALIAWQSTFYERVYGLEPSSYAPVLAALLPLGGILGGVGGGYLADRLSRSGRRGWVTAGATCVAAPCLAASCLAPTPELSYGALLVGFAFSEMWRAPSAVMARGIAPPSMGSTASALYLCVRNLVGGLGPLAVAGLIGVCGLQRAMLVVPAMYLASGLIFAKAEELYDKEMEAKVKAGLL